MQRILAFSAFVFSALLLPAQPAKTAANAKSQFEKKLTGDQEILHALNRLAYGPRPGDVASVKRMGLAKWIDLQLHPERVPEDNALTESLEALVQPAAQVQIGAGGQAFVFKMSMGGQQELTKLITQDQISRLRNGSDREALDLLSTFPRDKAVQVLAAMPAVRMRLLPLLDADLRRKVNAAAPPPILRQPDSSLAQAKLFRAIKSDRQLEEVLVDFWFNHFNVDAGKGAVGTMVASYERDAIRPHVLGNFRDLLGATANSAAMMFYLDNWQSSVAPPDGPALPKPAAPRLTRIALPGIVLQPLPHGLNENYARELMELHTLGVDGGYTQKDIVEVARCFTGWTLENIRRSGNGAIGAFFNANFAYNDEMHDRGEKTVLGVTIPAGGAKEDGEKVLDILARHRSTALLISKQLAQRFVADDPPPALIERMAATFRSTDGDIRAVLTTLFSSKEFVSEAAYRSKLKTPLEMVVSAVRATGAQVDDTSPLVREIATMGQPLYRKVEPTGYPNLSSQWVSSASLVERMNFGLQLTQDQIPGVKVDREKLAAIPEAAAQQLLFTGAGKQTIESVKTAAKELSDPGSSGGLIAGMLLGSPEFERR